MPAYDFSLNPPAPIADVVVAHPTRGVSSVIRGKLDCGADITVIPEDLAIQLGITPKSHIWTKGYDGTYSLRPAYYIRLVIEGFDLASVRCIATNRTNVLLGRNVMNRFIITLDGKALTFDIQDP
ncbi:MAG: retroviral-like aspartic protease family protein [Nitrososphaera sp.]